MADGHHIENNNFGFSFIQLHNGLSDLRQIFYEGAKSDHNDCTKLIVLKIQDGGRICTRT